MRVDRQSVPTNDTSRLPRAHLKREQVPQAFPYLIGILCKSMDPIAKITFLCVVICLVPTTPFTTAWLPHVRDVILFHRPRTARVSVIRGCAFLGAMGFPNFLVAQQLTRLDMRAYPYAILPKPIVLILRVLLSGHEDTSHSARRRLVLLAT